MHRTILRKKQFAKRIIGIEIVGFLSAILIVWIDEILDIPHIIFGARDTPINYFESIFESAVIALLAIVIISFTHTILKRLRYLEVSFRYVLFAIRFDLKSDGFPLKITYVSIQRLLFRTACAPNVLLQIMVIFLNRRAKSGNRIFKDFNNYIEIIVGGAETFGSCMERLTARGIFIGMPPTSIR